MRTCNSSFFLLGARGDLAPRPRQTAGEGRSREGRARTLAKYLQMFSAAVERSWLKGQALPAWQAPCRKNLQGTCAVSREKIVNSVRLDLGGTLHKSARKGERPRPTGLGRTRRGRLRERSTSGRALTRRAARTIEAWSSGRRRAILNTQAAATGMAELGHVGRRHCWEEREGV